MLFAAVVAASVPMLKLNNGVEMPAIAVGTWEYDGDYAQQSIAAALSVGKDAPVATALGRASSRKNGRPSLFSIFIAQSIMVARLFFY